jgi:starch synthase
MVSRLDGVKGFDLMAPVLDWLMNRDVQFVLLGTGQPEYEEMFASYQRRFPDRLRAFLKFDAALARRIYAGADLFLMTSRIEPCGLGQLIAMRYGAVPVVRATGGLADTVDDEMQKPGAGTGFTFSEYTAGALQMALERALLAFEGRPAWRSLQQRVMCADFSWSASARKYADLYKHAMAVHEA